MLLCTLFCIFAVIASAAEEDETKSFPDDFRFGAATTAYQVEGGWNVDGRGPSIWDEYVHSNPEVIKDRSNADVASNSYEYYLDDIKAIQNMGLDHYRFTISWPRILPNGDMSNINKKGIDYYNKLIDALIERNIEPMVTMYHNDLPLALDSIGFIHPDIVEYFKTYANFLFELYGDRVKYWITFNDPTGFCGAGGTASTAADGINEYLCGDNVLKAHAVVYHLYQNSYVKRFNGKIGIKINGQFAYPETNDEDATERAVQFKLGWMGHPIFSAEGNYPAVMIESIDNNSEQEGRANSRLPTLSKEWIETIRGSADFLGLNYYTSRFVERPTDPAGESPSFARDRNLIDIVRPEWKCSTASSWVCLVPQGLGDVLRWIKREYNNPVVYITENGWPDAGGLKDDDRIRYLRSHLEQVRDVLMNEESNLRGYSVWSLIDNFEWASGYSSKFGLYSVNISSERKERTPKKSASFIRTVIETRQIPKIN